MCGIVGYIGNKNQATNFVLDGLQSLEYRGYDSAGITTMIDKKPVTVRQVGRVENLRSQLEQDGVTNTSIAIGHTRWATHGAPTANNAHPHSNSAGTVFVVQTVS